MIKEIDLYKYIDFDGIKKELKEKTDCHSRAIIENWNDSHVLVNTMTMDFYTKMLMCLIEIECGDAKNRRDKEQNAD